MHSNPFLFLQSTKRQEEVKTTSVDTNEENVIWSGRPSQLLNLGVFLIAGVISAGILVGALFSNLYVLLVFLVLPIAWAVWKFWTLHCRIYQLTNERLRLFEGVLNQEIGEVELYRVKDTNIIRPFWLRICGLSTIKADTSDRTHPVVNIEAIRGGLEVRELLRKQVESLRDKKRVREVDFDGSGDGDEIEFDS